MLDNILSTCMPNNLTAILETNVETLSSDVFIRNIPTTILKSTWF